MGDQKGGRTAVILEFMKQILASGEIESRLQVVRSCIRRVQAQRGALVLATVALGGLLVLMAVDFGFAPLPMVMRWGLTGTWLLVVLAAARCGFAPLLKPIGLLQVARWLEGRHPEMEERLSTVLELAHGDTGVSLELLESLSRAAQADAATVDATGEVRAARTMRRWGRPAMALGGLMLVIFVVWPGEASRLLVRAVSPFSNVGNTAAGRFVVKPGNLEVIEGDAVRIEIGYDGREKNLTLAMELEGGQKISQDMAQDGRIFRYVLDPAKTSFHYRARAGREESDGFAITVWPQPAITLPRVTLNFPEYTQVVATEEPLGRGIEAVTGTRVTLDGRTNTAVEAAWLMVGGKRVANGTVETAANGGRVSVSWTLGAAASSEAVVMLRHRLGREIEALKFPVVVLEDRPPEVVLLSPIQRDLKVRPDEILRLKYEVTEDFSVAKLAVEVDLGGGSTTMLDGTLPLRVANTKPPRFKGEVAVVIGELRSRFPGTNEIRLRVRAEDARPADTGGPGVGFSEWVKIHIEEGAESLARQELRAEHEGAKQTIEEAIRATREARERMDWHRDEVKKGELGDNARKDLQEAGEKLASTDEKLKELAQQMRESVHAAKSDEVRQAAEQVAKAREDLENAPLQDEAVDRNAMLDQAHDKAEAAVKQLENVRNTLDRDREKIEDLAKLQELAQQQQELARQAAADLAKNSPTAPVTPAWQEQQKRMADELKQQLQDRPAAKSEALKAQAASAQALAEQAQEAAKAQENLKEEVQQISEKSLQQALATEQAKIASQAESELAQARAERNELADSLPEATAAAEAARDAIQKGENQAAADSAKAAAEALQDSAAKAKQAEKSLEKLAGREAQVAKAMADLAQGKPAEALKVLQETQAEAAADLAEAVAKMPRMEETGAMTDAKNSIKLASEQAQAAAADGQKGSQQEAAGQHEQAGQNFENSARQLAQAAAEFSQAAQAAAGQESKAQQAQAASADLAEAFQDASQAAASPQAATAAAQAAKAAAALAKSAQAGMQQMQGHASGKPGIPSQQAAPPQPQPGDKLDDGPRLADADPGVPPELAKLGISSADWEKIKATLKSDVGAGEGGAVPEEYRELVRGYFESMSKKSNP